ncbi:MAG: XdhC family protein [Chloroflexi bacterium]|nr:XdhC family protein [Chloroflexota bacterium]
MKEVYQEMQRLLRSGKRFATATVIATRGSTPRNVGAKMLIVGDGSFAGTVGGGCGEAEVWQEAMDALKDGKPRLVTIDLTNDYEEEGMICGGIMDVFIDPGPKGVTEAFLEAVARNEGVALATLVKGPEGEPSVIQVGAKMVVLEDGTFRGHLYDEALDRAIVQESLSALKAERCCTVKALEDIEVFIEVVERRPVLLIVGAGHVAQPVSQIGKLLGFNVVILDDRADYANVERFPEADRIIVAGFVDTLRSFPIDDKTYIIIITRGHRYDDACLREAVRSPAQYVGMIGSRRKVKLIFDHLRQLGILETALERVHAPIGLSIGAETPEEIAVSVMAEIVQVKRGRGSAAAMRACMGI